MAHLVHNRVGHVHVGAKAVQRNHEVVPVDLGLTGTVPVGVVAVRVQHVVDVAAPVGGKVGALDGGEVCVVHSPRNHTIGIGHQVAAGESATLAIVGNDLDPGRAVGVGDRRVRKRRGEPADSSRSGPMRVGAARSRIQVVVEPVELKDQVLLQGPGAHGWQVQPSGCTQHLIAITEAINVGVGHIGVRSGAGRVGVDPVVVLHRVGQTVGIGIGCRNAGHGRPRSAGRRRPVGLREPAARRWATPLVGRVIRRDTQRIRSAGQQTREDAGSAGCIDGTHRHAVYLDLIARDRLARIAISGDIPTQLD